MQNKDNLYDSSGKGGEPHLFGNFDRGRQRKVLFAGAKT